MSCNKCDKYYIGQTMNFKTCFKNHISAWRNKKPERSNVAKHLLTHNHTLTDLDSNIKILKLCDKGRSLDAWEELIIFQNKKLNSKILINEQTHFDSNIVFRNVFSANEREGYYSQSE